MRLTFRRLLAYLDGVLEQEDVEVVGQKIAESKVASQLIHRIRNAKTRVRLGAPRLNGTGMGLDPNTVAEYLDYTLDEERVTDFETVCFESDVHLAEVSASHEILTLVLSEAAQVERSIRERMYTLPDEISDGRRTRRQDEESAQSEPSTRAATPAAPPRTHSSSVSAGKTDDAVADDAKQEVTAMREMAEYLDDRKEIRWRSLLFTVALSFILIIVGLRAIGRFDASHPLLGRLLASSEPTDVNTRPPQNANAEDDLQPSTAIESTATPEPGENVVTPTPAEPVPAEPVPAEPVPAEPVPAEPVPAEPVPAEPVPAEPVPAEPVPAEPVPTEPVPAEPAPSEPIPPALASPEAKPPVVPPPAPGAPPLIADVGTPGDGGPPLAPGDDKLTLDVPLPKPDGTGAPELPPTVETPAASPTEVGLFNTPDEVMARFVKQESIWRRLPGRDVIRSGDYLRVPPFYRPQIAIAGSLQMTIVGPAELEMLPPLNGQPHLRIVYGRAIIETVATANLTIRIETGSLLGDVVLSTADSAVAIEVKGFVPVGKNPADGAQRATRWTTLRGAAMWVKLGDTSVPGLPLKLGESLVVLDNQVQAPVASSAPSWAAPQRTRDALSIAAEEAEKEFAPQRAMTLTLEELLNHRMADVRSAATQSLVYFGNYAPFVRSLKSTNREDNPDFFYRQREYDAMRNSLGLGPAAAKLLRNALELEFPDNPEVVNRLFQLCCGFDNAQLAAGEAKQLIADLSHPEQAVRVLALENLRRITGKMKTYNPLKSPDTQLKGISNWTKLLEAGEVKWQTMPTAFGSSLGS